MKTLYGTSTLWRDEMQTYMFAAGIVAIITGVIHSTLGEILIFRHLRKHNVVPTLPAPPLKERNVRIIWASWHLVTVFGWAFGVVLLLLSSPSNDLAAQTLVLNASIISFAVGSFIVLIATKGRHPGWIAMLIVAFLVWLGT